MGFLSNLEKFISEKSQLLEDTINKTLESTSSSIDISGMIDNAADKLGSFMQSGTSQLGQSINGQDMSSQASYTGYTGETINMEVKPAIDMSPETVLNKEFGYNGQAQNISMEKPSTPGVGLEPQNTETIKSVGVNLRKENTASADKTTNKGVILSKNKDNTVDNYREHMICEPEQPKRGVRLSKE